MLSVEGESERRSERTVVNLSFVKWGTSVTMDDVHQEACRYSLGR